MIIRAKRLYALLSGQNVYTHSQWVTAWQHAFLSYLSHVLCHVIKQNLLLSKTYANFIYINMVLNRIANKMISLLAPFTLFFNLSALAWKRIGIFRLSKMQYLALQSVFIATIDQVFDDMLSSFRRHGCGGFFYKRKPTFFSFTSVNMKTL
jgi:hypothetical protein